ncbi:hypothetical protein MPER_09421 [Moniliophthora perniciosa FA553]|nr:hypothetical protein MPER_09421 [Moniliophthora perniciosa FA553]
MTHTSHDGGYGAARTYNTDGVHKISAVATQVHADYGNWAPNWCCVTAVGNFNPDAGGDLVLWNVGIRIRFPPGCSILFPSAIITHSNVPVQPGEKRYSIVEYSSGGLFRWVYNGHMTDEEFLATASETVLRKWNGDKESRWRNSLRLYTRWYELERGDYKGEELQDCSELSDFVDITDDELPAKRRRLS